MKKLLSLLILSFLLLGALFAGRWFKQEQLQGPSAPAEQPLESLTETEAAPTSLNIEMPFYTQAPHANWDYPWQEACEEASSLLVANLYLDMNLNLEDYNTELLRLVDWQMEVFGAYEHTTVAQTQQMLLDNYGLESVAHTDPSFQDLQDILNEGHLIIAPFAGKLLDNPNFRNGGPLYHMLVIKGYDAEKNHVVTHDVGTRNGENYVYSWETVEKALHDWHDDDILLGDASFIEVLPPSQ